MSAQAAAIIVGVDDSPSAAHAALWAADLASAWDAPLRLVHATSTTEEPDWLRELRDAALRAGAMDASVELASGEPAGVLLERSNHAELLVVGSYGEGANAGLLAGSTAQALVERARPAVAVVRGLEPGIAPRRDGPIVVGVDGSAVAVAVLNRAADLAAAFGAHVLALHVWSGVGRSGGPSGQGAVAAEAQRVLDTQADGLQARRPAAVVERRVVADHPLRALLAQAPSARAVVVGRSDRPPSAGILLGSTCRGLVEFAPCSVVVVPDVRT